MILIYYMIICLYVLSWIFLVFAIGVFFGLLFAQDIMHLLRNCSGCGRRHGRPMHVSLHRSSSFRNSKNQLQIQLQSVVILLTILKVFLSRFRCRSRSWALRPIRSAGRRCTMPLTMVMHLDLDLRGASLDRVQGCARSPPVIPGWNDQARLDSLVWV